MLNKLLKKYAKNEKGLTLIELLVVIVILGIIAAIAVVSIGGIIQKTRDKAAVTEAVQIVNAAKLAHSTDNNAIEWSSTASDSNDLSDYLSNLKDFEWDVEFNEGVYSITGHDAIDVDNVDEDNDDVLTEAELTNFLGGVEQE